MKKSTRKVLALAYLTIAFSIICVPQNVLEQQVNHCQKKDSPVWPLALISLVNFLPWVLTDTS